MDFTPDVSTGLMQRACRGRACGCQAPSRTSLPSRSGPPSTLRLVVERWQPAAEVSGYADRRLEGWAGKYAVTLAGHHPVASENSGWGR
jgi:hypothetical protein